MSDNKENENIESQDTNDTSTVNSDNDSNNEVPEKNIKLIVIEAILAVVAVGFIVFALVTNSKKDQNTDSVSSQSTSNDTATVVDSQLPVSDTNNDALYTNIPAALPADELNNMTFEECQAEVEAGTMIALTANGIDVYVKNFTDEEYLASAITYDEEDLDKLIYSDLLQYYPQEFSGDRTVCQLYDTVSVNYAGFLDGEQFEGGTANDQQISLGAGNFIPGFEEGIIGMEVGEEKDITVTFPVDYQATDLAGKEVIFTITLNAIVAEPQELNDDIIAECFTEISTVDECRDYYKNILLQDKVYDMFLSAYYVSEIDEEIAKSRYESTMKMYEMMAAYYGMGVTDLITAYGTDVESFKLEVMTDASYTAISVEVYNAIAEYASLEITDDDIAAMAEKYGYTDVQEFFDAYGEASVMDYLLCDEVVNYIISLIP